MVTSCYGASISSSLHKLRNEISCVLQFIREELPALSDEDIFDLRVIFSELLINAIIHGNKNVSSKKVEIFVEVCGHEIMSVIKDEGAGFDYSVYTRKSKKYSQLENIYIEKGRGLYLVRFMSDNLSFNNTGNEVSFIKRVRNA